MKHRRNFIITALRGAGLALLGGGAFVLARRQGCSRDHPCAACPLFNGCGLEKARNIKPGTPRNHAGKPA